MERDQDQYGASLNKTNRINKSKVRNRQNQAGVWRIQRDDKTGKYNKFFHLCSYMLGKGIALKEIRTKVMINDRRNMGLL